MLNWKEYAFLSEKYLRVQERMYFISPEELEDIRQNVFLHILQNRALVVSLPPLALDGFIERAVGRYGKRWNRYCKRFKLMEEEQVPTTNETRQGELSEYGFVILKLDIAGILEYLTSRQVAICRCFMDGKTPRQIQKMVRCSQVTMTSELDQIRQRFLAFDYC